MSAARKMTRYARVDRFLICRRFLFLVLVSLFGLAGCASEMTAADSTFGWRGTGLSFPNAKKTGGVHKVIAVGNTLFAMDAFTPDSAPESRPNQWRIWKGRVGSLQWEQLPLPEGDVPQSWATDGNDLCVGSKYTGRVYSYRISSGIWKSYKLPDRRSARDSFSDVDAMISFDGKLFSSIELNITGGHFCWITDLATDSGSFAPCLTTDKRGPIHKLVRVGSELFATNYQFGTYRYHPGDSAWVMLPSAWAPNVEKQLEMVSALGVHNGKIHIGHDGWWQGIYRWDDDHWTSLCPKSTDGKDRDEAAQTQYALESFKGRLIAAGSMGAAPTMQLPSDTLKFGNWRIIDENWSNALGDSPPDTRDLLGIGDTLYAAGWYGLVKVPFDQLDRMARPMFKD
jgi:hypothetical protein